MTTMTSSSPYRSSAHASPQRRAPRTSWSRLFRAWFDGRLNYIEVRRKYGRTEATLWRTHKFQIPLGWLFAEWVRGHGASGRSAGVVRSVRDGLAMKTKFGRFALLASLSFAACGGTDTETESESSGANKIVGDCPDAELCKVAGQCGVLDGGSCVARSDEECAASDQCRIFGWCQKESESFCRATSNADCEASEVCATEGACTFNGVGGCAVE